MVTGHDGFPLLSFTFQFLRKESLSRCFSLLGPQRDRDFLKIAK